MNLCVPPTNHHHCQPTITNHCQQYRAKEGARSSTLRQSIAGLHDATERGDEYKAQVKRLNKQLEIITKVQTHALAHISPTV